MPASAEILRIRHSDTDWHDPFFVAVEGIFGCGETFRRWAQMGGWNESYEVFALRNDRQLASIIGVMGMHFLFGGVEHEGVQLGAVGTLPDFRGTGLSRHLMNRVLAEHSAPEKPVILFANDTVLDFYPRFGFRPVAQKRFVLARSLEPAVRPIRRLDLAIRADRALLADYCARAAPINGRFAARDYFPIMLWNLIQSPRQVVLTDDLAAVLVVSQVDRWLIVHDVYAPSVFDLIHVLASAIDAPVEGIEFCFDPAEWLAAMTMKVESYTEDPCFLLWNGNLSPGNCRFPDLAHT
ncbi:MAG: GNAT family N-acetyltransferase [Steroidobacteraceae bacterium]